MVEKILSKYSIGHEANNFCVHALWFPIKKILIAKNKTFNGKNGYINLRHDVIKQLQNNEVISINYVKSVLNLTDPLTKP